MTLDKAEKITRDKNTLAYFIPKSMTKKTKVLQIDYNNKHSSLFEPTINDYTKILYNKHSSLFGAAKN